MMRDGPADTSEERACLRRGSLSDVTEHELSWTSVQLAADGVTRIAKSHTVPLCDPCVTELHESGAEQ